MLIFYVICLSREINDPRVRYTRTRDHNKRQAGESGKNPALNITNAKIICLMKAVDQFSEKWIKKLEEYVPWFEEQEAIKTNEALRPDKPKTHDDLFGLDGSFRQLIID